MYIPDSDDQSSLPVPCHHAHCSACSTRFRASPSAHQPELRLIRLSHLVTTERFHTAHSDYLSASNPRFRAQLELTVPVFAFFGTFQIYTTQPRIRDRDNQAEQIEKETDEIGYRLITETTTNCFRTITGHFGQPILVSCPTTTRFDHSQTIPTHIQPLLPTFNHNRSL